MTEGVVSSIKNTWLRRLALVAVLLLVCALYAVVGAFELVAVLIGVWFLAFREAWSDMWAELVDLWETVMDAW